MKNEIPKVVIITSKLTKITKVIKFQPEIMETVAGVTVKRCPASLFQNLLILLFGSEDCHYLVDHPSYKKPKLTDSDNAQVSSNLKTLQHGTQYNIDFEQISEESPSLSSDQ